jgi:hypothetical protein
MATISRALAVSSWVGELSVNVEEFAELRGFMAGRGAEKMRAWFIERC